MSVCAYQQMICIRLVTLVSSWYWQGGRKRERARETCQLSHPIRVVVNFVTLVCSASLCYLVRFTSNSMVLLLVCLRGIACITLSISRSVSARKHAAVGKLVNMLARWADDGQANGQSEFPVYHQVQAQPDSYCRPVKAHLLARPVGQRRKCRLILQISRKVI